MQAIFKTFLSKLDLLMLYKKQLIPTTELSWKLKIVHSRSLKDFAHVTTAKCANFVKAFVDTEAVRECF